MGGSAFNIEVLLPPLPLPGGGAWAVNRLEEPLKREDPVPCIGGAAERMVSIPDLWLLPLGRCAFAPPRGELVDATAAAAAAATAVEAT